jgi:ribosome maturation factor RimP
MGPIQEKLMSMFTPAVSGLGFELWGLEYTPQGKHSVLRLYIDSEDGVTLDDCQQVSYQVSGILEVEDPIKGQYSLEVSSPGVDRPLFTTEQFARYVGANVKVRLRQAVLGRRKFSALIDSVEDDEICLVDETGEAITVHISDIDKSNLVPEF